MATNEHKFTRNQSRLGLTISRFIALLRLIIRHKKALMSKNKFTRIRRKGIYPKFFWTEMGGGEMGLRSVAE